ncbi:hypothetical protein T265_00416 [Opisthorchis viverrini]|uniref:Uncharacterized protein n=1 Tax=Opisthorchis viverrini TaxID=6198 RepID=A0A075A201_OPIVI|nr:hypothetical protein T265_00416 [Opisthorchis viverrini]KER33728.1 hypothetical protein T265_00416 [Opisthorchis viverrini]
MTTALSHRFGRQELSYGRQPHLLGSCECCITFFFEAYRLHKACYLQRSPFSSKRHFDQYTHLQINLVFTRDLTESLVYDILQLNVLHTGRFMFQ